MAAVLGSAFSVTGEWDTVGLLRGNIFGLLCLKSTAPICYSVMLYHWLVLPIIMCAKYASFFCLSAGYVHSLLPCPQLPWVQQYFGVGGADGRACPRPLPSPRPRLHPRPRPRP